MRSRDTHRDTQIALRSGAGDCEKPAKPAQPAVIMSLTIEVPHAKSPSLGVLILTLNLALFLPQTINRTPPYVLAGTGGGSMLGDVNISAILDSFSVGYDKRVRPNYGGTY